ncbi:SMC domain-containing protein [gamma proteobacterium BDW918]|uniref:Chromosome segregation protein SMC n=1 Tax=Zhongshania aliphaticivorans TaxID=1470434 RepID=A0A127M4V1_9GAMM|nr:ATP-binding protein [Zhongshania aliphaticivorans]AMO68283.1 chromosome segregation protein SMC [Zhongshania aliphaticivorans]EIF44176.1 SMC domain-containing protein [gamma proteobacterium BDW918]
MLSKFSVKNFRNFTDWLVFDLSSQQYEFNTNAVNNGIIQHAMIYGPNGGGKSNLGLAMVDPLLHLTDSPNYLKSLDINYLNGGMNVTIAEFAFEYRIDGANIRYNYGKKSREAMVYESLFINEERILHVDRRESNQASIHLQGAEHLKSDVGTSKISLLKYVRSNTILDETPTNQLFSKLLSFIEGMAFFRSLDSTKTGDYVGKNIGVKRLSQSIIDDNSVNDFEQFLNNAGVKCSLIVKTNNNGEESIYFNYGKTSLEFGLAASTGTLSLGIFYFWWLRLSKKEITFAYIDEFDAFYHHALAAKIVERVTSTSCQTIMTTHNTGIMSNDLLRPDCYFVLDKIISPITALTSKELRKAHNLEKIYKGLSS